jgi:hypothetical protein
VSASLLGHRHFSGVIVITNGLKSHNNQSEVVIRTVQKLPHERGDEANSILFTRPFSLFGVKID